MSNPRSHFSDPFGGITRVAVGTQPTQTILEMIDALNPISHWRLNEASGSVFADRMAVSNMMSFGERQNLTRALVDNDVSQNSLALNGVDSFLEAPLPASNPYEVTAGAMGILCQADTSSPVAQIIMARHGPVPGVADDLMAIEYRSGGQLHGVRNDGTGTVRFVTSTIGANPAGDCFLALLSWGEQGLKLYGGSVLIGAVEITNWEIPPGYVSGPIRIGSPIVAQNRFDGIVAHAFILGTQPTDAQVNALAMHARSISWAQDISAGDVQQGTGKTISLKTPGAHYKSPISPQIVDQGDLGITSVVSEDLDYLAGNVSGFGDLIGYRFVSANGSESQNRDITINVISDPEEVQFPMLITGNKSWVSTTRSNFGSPSHGSAVENLPDVDSGAVVFTQPTVGLRGTWDNLTFDVPVIRANGIDQCYTRAVALPPPGIVVVCCSFDAASAGFRAITGVRSTGLAGGDALEDAWHLNKSATGTMRALVAASSGLTFTDVSAVLGEKLLVVMRADANGLTVFCNGFKSNVQAILSGRLVSNAEQALFGKYYNDVLTAFMAGGISNFYQNDNSQTNQIVRELIEYYQSEWFPSIDAPPSMTLSAGDIQQGVTFDFDVIAAMAAQGADTSNIILTGIDEQSLHPQVTISVVGGKARITVPAGATIGSFSCIGIVQETNP